MTSETLWTRVRQSSDKEFGTMTINNDSLVKRARAGVFYSFDSEQSELLGLFHTHPRENIERGRGRHGLICLSEGAVVSFGQFGRSARIRHFTRENALFGLSELCPNSAELPRKSAKIALKGNKRSIINGKNSDSRA